MNYFRRNNYLTRCIRPPLCSCFRRISICVCN